MNDPPSNAQDASTADDSCVRRISQDAERERLIDDLAFLVVRQHRRGQRTVADDDPTTGCVDSEAKLTAKTRDD